MFTESDRYDLLHLAGLRRLKKLADEGRGFEWDLMKSALWSAASAAGFEPPTDLTNRVLRSLEAQHAHFVHADRVPPAATADRRL